MALMVLGFILAVGGFVVLFLSSESPIAFPAFMVMLGGIVLGGIGFILRLAGVL